MIAMTFFALFHTKTSFFIMLDYSVAQNFPKFCQRVQKAVLGVQKTKLNKDYKKASLHFSPKEECRDVLMCLLTVLFSSEKPCNKVDYT